MSIESHLTALTDAIKENTAVLKQVLAAGNATTGTPAPVETPVPVKKTKATPAPVPTPEPEPEIAVVPTKVAPAAAAPADTPHVAARQEPGHPDAGEHIDVDEVLAQINEIVKSKIAGNDAKKQEWVNVRTAMGVERISDLKPFPDRLMQALAAAKKL